MKHIVEASSQRFVFGLVIRRFKTQFNCLLDYCPFGSHDYYAGPIATLVRQSITIHLPNISNVHSPVWLRLAGELVGLEVGMAPCKLGYKVGQHLPLDSRSRQKLDIILAEFQSLFRDSPRCFRATER